MHCFRNQRSPIVFINEKTRIVLTIVWGFNLVAYTSNCINIPSTSCSPLINLIYFPLLFSHVFSLFSGRLSSIHHINGNKIDLNCFQNKNTRTIYILVLHHRVNHLVLVESYQSIMHCHIITLMSLLISLKICVILRWLWRPMDLLFIL